MTAVCGLALANNYAIYQSTKGDRIYYCFQDNSWLGKADSSFKERKEFYESGREEAVIKYRSIKSPQPGIIGLHQELFKNLNDFLELANFPPLVEEVKLVAKGYDQKEYDLFWRQAENHYNFLKSVVPIDKLKESEEPINSKL